MKPQDGMEYEKIVTRLLCERGFKARRTNGDNAHGTDLEVDGVDVEVKGSMLHAITHGRRGFAWLLGRAGKPRGVHGEIIILLAHADNRDDLFVLPVTVLADQNYVELPVTGQGDFYQRSKLMLFHNGFDYLQEAIRSV